MNFSGIPFRSSAGKLLRYPLRLIPTEARVVILQGRLRGRRWIAGSGIHGYWLGSYEYEKRRTMEALITPGSVVYDVGAHVGFYTLLFSELVGPAGRVVAFEPNPRNVGYLKKHLELNGITNAHVVEAAASDFTGMAAFADDSTSFTGRLSTRGNLDVSTVTLDEFVQREIAPKPDYIKIDVEGAELSVLRGAGFILSSCRPTLFLATHGEELHAQCCEFLQSLGYRLQTILPCLSVMETDEIVAVHHSLCDGRLRN